jgi:hypothetical protein
MVEENQIYTEDKKYKENKSHKRKSDKLYRV